MNGALIQIRQHATCSVNPQVQFELCNYCGSAGLFSKILVSRSIIMLILCSIVENVYGKDLLSVIRNSSSF